jgi:hypothetical protein
MKIEGKFEMPLGEAVQHLTVVRYLLGFMEGVKGTDTVPHWLAMGVDNFEQELHAQLFGEDND